MKTLKLLGLLILLSNHAKGDVIYSPFAFNIIAISLEGIISYELPFTKSNTINFWGGFGCVSAVDRIKNPAIGGEIAFEIRQYLNKEKYSGFNVGFYTGFALMKYPSFYHDIVSYRNSVGIVPGLKLTYKHRLNSWLAGEPYLGFSIPFYGDDVGDLFHRSERESGLIFTIGIRIGFNKAKQYKL